MCDAWCVMRDAIDFENAFLYILFRVMERVFGNTDMRCFTKSVGNNVIWFV